MTTVQIRVNDIYKLTKKAGWCFTSKKAHPLVRGKISELIVDPGYPVARFDAKGKLLSIQLRELPPRGCDLVVGCGNVPTMPIYSPSTTVEEMEDFYDDREYAENIKAQTAKFCHCHAGDATVDMDMWMNPTIIGDVTAGALAHIPDKYFERELAEGVDVGECPDLERCCKYPRDPVRDFSGRSLTLRSTCRVCVELYEYHYDPADEDHPASYSGRSSYDDEFLESCAIASLGGGRHVSEMDGIDERILRSVS